MPLPDEELIMVDENDRVLGSKKFRDVGDSDRWRITEIWVENSQGHVLMQKRSKQKRLNPGMWECAAAGTVTYGDDYDTTARRELEEEIGLTGVKLIETKKMTYKAVLGWRWSQGYKTVCDWPIERFKIQPEEVESIVWCDKDEVIRALRIGDPKYPAAAKIWLEMFDLN